MDDDDDDVILRDAHHHDVAYESNNGINDNIRMREQVHQNHGNNNDNVASIISRPGAFPIDGIDARQVSQQTFVYSDSGATGAEEEKEHSDDTPSMIVIGEAEVMNDDNRLVLPTENIVAIDDDKDDHNEQPIKKWKIAVATCLLAVVIAAVIVSVAILVPRSNSSSSSSSSTTKTATSRPTIAPPRLMAQHVNTATTNTPTIAPRLSNATLALRSVLLNHNVSSIQDLEQTGTPQNNALTWLGNDNFTIANPSNVEANIIDRYVLAVIYYANGGAHWTDRSNFLTFESICSWHNDSSINGTGAFCLTLMNVSNGNYTQHVCHGVTRQSLPIKGNKLTLVTLCV